MKSTGSLSSRTEEIAQKAVVITTSPHELELKKGKEKNLRKWNDRILDK
jgi:hypothetical protein